MDVIEDVKKMRFNDGEMWFGPVIYSFYEQEKIIFDLIRKTDYRLLKSIRRKPGSNTPGCAKIY